MIYLWNIEEQKQDYSKSFICQDQWKQNVYNNNKNTS